jgi:hypothetical protein
MVVYWFFIFVLNLLMAGYAHLVCLFGSWHVYLDVEVTPTSTKVHTISICFIFSTNSSEFAGGFCKRILKLPT